MILEVIEQYIASLCQNRKQVVELTDRDVLYKAMQQAEEERKRANFDYFMDGLEGGLKQDLDKLYQSGNMEEYSETLQHIKERGVRVFRNGKGFHKIDATFFQI